MDFRTLVEKKLRCTYAPLCPEEESEIAAIIRCLENTNRILGKPVKAGVSPEYHFYIAMCHLRRNHRDGFELLLACADGGCGAAWWELFRLSDDPMTQACCRAKSYSLGCQEAIDYANCDLEVFSAEVIALMTSLIDEDSRYLKTLLLLAHEPDMGHLLEILGSQYVSSKVRVEEKDRESVRILLRSALDKGDPDYEDYEYTVGTYDSIATQWGLMK